MDKAGIADTLEKIGTLLELKAENPFKIRAYTNAARSIETWGGTVADLQNPETLAKIPGIGKGIAGVVRELAESGRSEIFEQLRAEFPADILELFTLPGLGAKKIKALYEKLAVSSIAQLKEACDSGRVAELPGFGKTTQEKLAQAIADRVKHVGSFQLGAIAGEAETLRDDLCALEAALQVSVAGSYRRRKEIVRDLDFIVATKEPAAISEAFVRHPLVESVIVAGATKTSVRLRSGIQCDLRVVTPAEYPFALNYFTGSKEHNIVMRNRALQRGWTLNEYRLSPVPVDPAAKRKAKISEPIPEVREEAELYRSLGLDYVPPELRENCGEFEAAEKHALPRLLEKENLRGTFHCHTTASDGRNSLEEMAAAAEELGLQYLGIADHSRSSVQARGLDEARLRVQLATIRRLNSERDGDFRIFAGVECDILRDGSLDFPDEFLAELDYVVASVHSAFTLPEAEMTERIIRAHAKPLRDVPGAPDRPAAPAARALRGRHPGGAGSGRGNGHVDRDQRRAQASRSRLALVAAGEGERGEVRDQSRRARGRAAAGVMVRRGRGAQRLAHESRRDELPAAGEDRGGAFGEAEAGTVIRPTAAAACAWSNTCRRPRP